MSDEKLGQKSNIFPKVSAWLGAVGALLLAIAGVTGSLNNIVSDSSTIWKTLKQPFEKASGTTPSANASTESSPENSENQAITGAIEVQANSLRGELFTNERSSTETYDFFATGLWSYNKTLELSNNPAGNSEYSNASSNYKLPGSPEGSLIIRKRDGSYQYIGVQAELTLEPGEKVFFTINDATDGPSDFESYSDNDGNLKIEWSCKTCR